MTLSDEPYDEPIELRGLVEGLVYDGYYCWLEPTSGNQMVEYVEYDDDSNGNFDARLIVNLSAEKDYYVILTQYNPAISFG